MPLARLWLDSACATGLACVGSFMKISLKMEGKAVM